VRAIARAGTYSFARIGGSAPGVVLWLMLTFMIVSDRYFHTTVVVFTQLLVLRKILKPFIFTLHQTAGPLWPCLRKQWTPTS
jgi:hypothetical protein